MASYKILGEDKDGKTKIKITVELGYNEKGNRIRRHKTVSVNSTSERVIKKAITTFEREVANEGTNTRKQDDLNYDEAVEIWWTNHVSQLSANTQRAYLEALDVSREYFGKMKIRKIKKIHVVEYKTYLETKIVKNALLKFQVFKAVLTKMVEWELLPDHPARNISIPKNKKQMDFYNEEEIKLLFDAIENAFPKYKMFIKLAVLSGMRSGEIRGLTTDNIDFKNNEIHVKHNLVFKKDVGYFLGPTKTKTERTIKMPSKFMNEFKDYVDGVLENKKAFGEQWTGLPGVTLVFCNDDGSPNDDTVYGKGFRKIQTEHGLRRIRIHDLRHTHASFLLSQDANIKEIQERLGHSSISMTIDTYSHLTEKDKRETASHLDRLL